MAVDRTWRSEDRRYLVDQIVEEPGVAYRIWDADGLPVGEVREVGQLGGTLARLGVQLDRLEQVPVEDPWCE